MSPVADTADALRPALTPEGFRLLNSLPDYSEEMAAATNVQLRKQGWSAETVAAVLTQLRLRKDAERKFGAFASRMLFTREGLQQSTRLPVAAAHADRFRRAGLAHVVDLGCGMGADALAFASAGMAVTAVEADEPTAAAATVNLAPFPEARVVHSTAEAFTEEHSLSRPNRSGESTEVGLWLDPARRRESGGAGPTRVWHPEAFSPPLSYVIGLAETGVPLGVKLGPGIPHERIPADCEAQWVSIDGELVEVVLWFNALARPGVRRSAMAMTTSGEPDLTATSAELRSSADFGHGPAMEPAGRAGLSGLVCEPDPAVIRAGLVADAAHRAGGRMLDEHIAYFCTDSAPPATLVPLVRCFRVIEVLDFSPRALKRWCAQNHVTSLEIKKRGVDVVPERLRKQVLPSRTSGPKTHVTLIITRLHEERVAAVVEPLPR